MRLLQGGVDQSTLEQLEQYKMDNDIGSDYNLVKIALEKLVNPETPKIEEKPFAQEKKEIARQIERGNFDEWIKQLQARDSGKA
jgi:hypothetical protein